MAGAVAERELKAVATFAVATRADEAELRALLRATPTPGAVSLRFEREPDYFTGEHVAGAEDTTIIARQDGRLVCMGRCSRREVYIDGRLRTAGYLGELRLAPGASRAPAVLRDGYAFFARLEAADPADFYFTSVAETNARARAVLETRRLGLPDYVPWGKLATVAWPVRHRSARKEQATWDRAELTAFLDAEAKRHALSMPWQEAAWDRLSAHGLTERNFVVVRKEGRIVAAAGIWDQSAWRQTVVAAYAGAIGVARPLVNGWLGWMRRPKLPAPGDRLRHACVHSLAISTAADKRDVAVLLDGLEWLAEQKRVEWLVASVAAEDALRTVLGERPGARDYVTCLYGVRLAGVAGQVEDLGGQIFRPEAGLL